MRWLSLLCWLLTGFIAGAQQFPSTHYTDRDILPNNTVRTLFKAIDGTLWIGTDNGLVSKFNDQITSYFKEDGLTQNNIWAFAQDQSERLWIGSYGKGLTTFKNNKLQAYTQNSKLPNQEITKLLIHDQSLFIGTSDGIAIINLADQNQIKSIDPNPVAGEQFIVQDFIAVDNEVYVISYVNGIHRVDTTGKEIKLVQTSTETNLYAAYTSVDSIYLSGKEKFKRIASYNVENPSAFEKAKPLGKSVIWDYYKVGDQLFAAAWGIYANDGGVYELTSTGMQLRNDDFGITSMQVTSLAHDDDLGFLYVGTLDDGFYEIRLDEKVQFFPSAHEKIIGFASVDETTATLWSDGLKIDLSEITASKFKKAQTDYVQKLPDDLPKYEDYFYELDYNTTANDIVFYSVKSRNESFWVNTSIGIYQFNTNGKLLNYLPVHALEISFTANDQLLEPNFFHGTRVYESVAPMSYIYYDETETQQNPRFVVGSLQQGNKTYLTSIFNGLYSYENEKFSSYVANDIWNEKRLRFITHYGDNQIAVSNEDGDVFIINDDSSNFNVTKVNRNITHGNTITFLTSYNETLIIGTAKGIVLYNNGREIFLDDEQGIDGKIHNGFVKGDLLLLGSDRGSYQLKLADIIAQTNRVEAIELKSILVNGANTVWNAGEKLQLAANENSLELQLGTNKHPYPQKLAYSYRLNETQQWLPMEDTDLSLPLLDSGAYKLYIKVTDASTGFTVDQEVLNFHISTPFYKSFWFLVLFFLGAIGLLVVYFRLKRKRANQRSREQEAVTKRIEEVKLEALLSQMNPHFVFNSLNSVQYFISNDENDKAMKYLSTFSDLMRANLNNTTRPFLTLEEEIDYLKKYIALENARFSDRIQVTFTVDQELSLTQTSIPTMLLQPFVENAFVHAFPERVESPRLDIAFTKIDDHQYRCTIQDNGIGNASLNKNKRHISKGTQLVEERLSFLGYVPTKALQIQFLPEGTIVFLQLEQ